MSCNNSSKKTIDNSKNDSIEKYLKLAGNTRLPNKKRDLHNKKALSYIDLDKGDTTALGYLFRVTRISIKTNNLQEYKKNSLVHLEYSLKRKDTLNLARYYRLRGSYYKDKNIYDSAFFYYNKSEKFCNKIKNVDNELVYIYFNKSIIQNRFADYLGADLNASRALTLSVKIKNYNLTYHILNNLGNINHNLKNYEKAINYNEDALNVYDNKNFKTSEVINFDFYATSLNKIGNSYRELGNYKKAIFYFNKALKHELKFKSDPEIRAYIYNNLGFIYLKQRKLNKLPNVFEKALKIFDSIENNEESAISNMYLSDYYFQKKDTSKSIFFSEKALQLAMASNNSYYYLTTLSHAGAVNKDRASYYIEKYHQVNDSLLFQERKARNQFFKIQLETDQIVQEKNTLISKKKLQNAVITIVLSFVILLFIIFKLKTKHKQFQLIQERQNANEEVYQLMLNYQVKEENIKLNDKKTNCLRITR